MTPEQLDFFGEQHARQVREMVIEKGVMRLGANIMATFDPKRGHVEPTIVSIVCRDKPAHDCEWLTGAVRGGVHAMKGLAAVAFGRHWGRVVIAYERAGLRRVWSAPYNGGHELPELEEGEVPDAFIPDLRAVPRAFENLMVPPVVHILHQGQALCGKPGIPGSWEPGHMWIGLTELDFDRGAANCPGCVAIAPSLGPS